MKGGLIIVKLIKHNKEELYFQDITVLLTPDSFSESFGTQQIFTCWKSTIDKLEKALKYVESYLASFWCLSS